MYRVLPPWSTAASLLHILCPGIVLSQLPVSIAAFRSSNVMLSLQLVLSLGACVL